MTGMCRAFKQLGHISFILLLFAIPGLCSKTYYVAPHPDTPCPAQPCLTLSQYVKEADNYFTSNTTFVFLAGEHSLSADLTLKDVSNVTLTGDNGLLPQVISKVKCARPVNIKFETTLAIKVTALAFTSCGKEFSNFGALHLSAAQDFLLSDCILHDNAFTALSVDQSSLTLNKVAFESNSQSALKIFNSTVNSICDSSFSNNSGFFGGAAAIINSTVNFTGANVFVSNLATSGGSLYLQDTTARFTGISLFRDGRASSGGGGGAIYVTSAHLDFEGETRFISNAGIWGGGIYAESVSIINFHRKCSFVSNSATYGGAGIMAWEGTTIRFVGNCSFINNIGGGILTLNTSMNFDGNIDFVNNSALTGAGIYASYGATMSFNGNCSFVNNSAHNGGAGIYAEGGSTMTLAGNCSFISNSATVGGAGIFAIEGSTMSLYGNYSFISNSATYGGAAIGVREGSIISLVGSCSFINNTGGGVSAFNSTVSFDGKCNFINNYSGWFGAGISAAYGATMNFNGNCSFVNNSAHNGGGGIYAGEGTTMTLTGNYSFISNSVGRWGGGILVYQFNTTMTLNGNYHFIGNSAAYGGAGISASEGTRISLVGSCSFVNNTGGGVYASNTTLSFDGSCEFINNSAGWGGGISANKYTTVNFDGNCSFINNVATFDGGAISAVNTVVMNFDGNCRFINNSASLNGGGITGFTTILNVYGDCTFINNSATYGGGIALDTSVLYLFQQRGSRVHFIGNYAHRGGAISIIDSPHQLSLYCLPGTWLQTIDCFFQLQNLSSQYNFIMPARSLSINASLIFENNSALQAGDDLYGGRIDSCGWSQHQKVDPLTSGELINILAPGLNEERISAISSAPIKVCICDGTGYPDCDREISVTTHPGESFTLTAVAVGQRDGTVPTVIQSIFEKGSTANLRDDENLQSSSKACTTLNYTVFSNASFEKMNVYAKGPCGPDFGQALYILVKLQPCPDGFELSQTTRSCICEKRLQTYTNTCDINDETISRDGDFWVGYDKDTGGLILHPHCPLDYCTSAAVKFTLNDTDLQCNYNRSGLLCGDCQHDLSLVLGTSRCRECSDAYLALLIVFAIAGLLLVFFLLICKLTVADGTISGLIFYANIVSVNRSIFFPEHPTLYTRILSVFIAWLNLDLGIEFCFYDGMDTYVKTWLQFVFPVYIWVLVGLIILVSHYSNFLARLLGNNPVAILATLLLLSYTKLLRTIIAALSFTYVDYPSGSVAVWLYDGNVEYLRGKHIALFVVACLVFLVFFLPYTLVLLLGQWLVRSNWRIFSWINKPSVKAFMDAYQAPYKDYHRYWTGLLLVVRFAILLIFASNPLNDPTVNLLVISVSTLCLDMWAWSFGGVYNRQYLDVLEASFVLNLGILAAGTYHVRQTGGNQAAMAYTSASAALATFAGIIVYHIAKQLHARKCIPGFGRPMPVDDAPVMDDAENPPCAEESGEESPISRAQRFPHGEIIDYSQLREPLLEEQ